MEEHHEARADQKYVGRGCYVVDVGCIHYRFNPGPIRPPTESLRPMVDLR